MDASPQVVLEHQFPDGIALIHILTTRLGLTLTAAGEGCIEGIEAREPMFVANTPRQGMGARLIELREIDIARLVRDK